MRGRSWVLGLALGCGGVQQPPTPFTGSADRVDTRRPVETSEVDAPVDIQQPAMTALMQVQAVANPGEQGGLDIDLISDGWPGAASIPELRIGQAVYTESEHVSPTVLRFVLPAGHAASAGAEAAVWYGEREMARFVVPELQP
jgi:hypothetical protein